MKSTFSEETFLKQKEFFDSKILSDKQIVALLERQFFNGKPSTLEDRQKLMKTDRNLYLICAFYYQSLYVDEHLNALFTAIFTLDKIIAAELTNIEAKIDAISKQTGANVTSIRQDMDEFNEKVLPAVKKVAEVFDNLKTYQTEGDLKKGGIV